MKISKFNIIGDIFTFVALIGTVWRITQTQVPHYFANAGLDLISLITLVCLFCYFTFESSKNFRGFYNASLVLYGVGRVVNCFLYSYGSFGRESALICGLAVAVDAIVLASVAVLLFAKDLGKSKSLGFALVTLIQPIVGTIGIYNSYTSAGDSKALLCTITFALTYLVISGTIITSVVAKYADKKSRGSK